MSTILKALRKLEEEKREDMPLPSLDAKSLVAPGEPLERSGGSRRLPVFAALGALMLAGLAAGWWWMGRSPAPTERVASGAPLAPVRSAARPTPPPPPQRGAAAPPPAPAPSPAPEPAAPAARPAPPSPAVPVAAAPVPSAARQVAGSAQAPPGGALPPAREAPAPAAPARSAAPPRPAANRVARKAEKTSVARHVAHPGAKRAATPDVAVIPPPPHVEVEQIIWLPDPQRRVATVRVEGRDSPLRLHEGDAVGTLVVDEIDPDAVIFLDGASRVRKGLAETP